MDKELIITAVPDTMIDLIWDKVEPLIKMVETKAPDDIVANAVKDALRTGKQLLVIIYRESKIIALNVLDVRTLDSGKKVLYIPITAGDEMESWLDNFLMVAKAIAKDYECVELRGLAIRRGWLKKLKPHGWEEMFTTIRCELGE